MSPAIEDYEIGPFQTLQQLVGNQTFLAEDKDASKTRIGFVVCQS